MEYFFATLKKEKPYCIDTTKLSTTTGEGSGNSVFAIFIAFEVDITGKILKKRLIFSKNIIEMVRLPYHFCKN